MQPAVETRASAAAAAQLAMTTRPTQRPSPRPFNARAEAPPTLGVAANREAGRAPATPRDVAAAVFFAHLRIEMDSSDDKRRY